MCVCVCVYQTIKHPSSLPDTAFLPSGLIATAVTCEGAGRAWAACRDRVGVEEGLMMIVQTMPADRA